MWGYYLEGTPSLGSGISAMPSMHVSIAVLVALVSSQVSKKAGCIFWLFALIIQIGSVHLGWHYAIDGYMATALTVLIWKAVSYYYNKRQESYMAL